MAESALLIPGWTFRGPAGGVASGRRYTCKRGSLWTAQTGCKRSELQFTEDSIDALAADINDRIENIGARRLHTVLEKLIEEISFTASDRTGQTATVDAACVRDRVAPLAQKGDLSRFIL